MTAVIATVALLSGTLALAHGLTRPPEPLRPQGPVPVLLGRWHRHPRPRRRRHAAVDLPTLRRPLGEHRGGYDRACMAQGQPSQLGQVAQ